MELIFGAKLSICTVGSHWYFPLHFMYSITLNTCIYIPTVLCVTTLSSRCCVSYYIHISVAMIIAIHYILQYIFFTIQYHTSCFTHSDTENFHDGCPS